MNTDEYKLRLQEISSKYPKRYRGVKYIKKWDKFWHEKNIIADALPLQGVKSILDIGTGIGMLPYILKSKGYEVEGTDITEDITGDLFIEACALINLPRHCLWVNPNESLNLSRNYDLIVATRTEFDRADGFNWEYFINDCFTFCNKIFIHTNSGKKAYRSDLDWLQPFLQRHAYNWCVVIEKDQWQNR